MKFVALVSSSRSSTVAPFVDRAREIFLETGVSTVLVMGGSGDYLDVADTVIMMDAYRAWMSRRRPAWWHGSILRGERREPGARSGCRRPEDPGAREL
ncbi:MAG: P-loop domain-containing protein [Bacillota bacterium]|jgi:predicted ABC-class ATPase